MNQNINTERSLYGKPIRKGVTDEFYPSKMTLEDFRKIIISDFDSYATNMRGIKRDEDKFIEEWVEQYLNWLDIEQE